MTNPSFIEVVKVKDGLFVNPQPHIERIFRTTLHFYNKPLTVHLSIEMIPLDLRKGLVKCRIVYGKEVISIDFESYTIRTIQSLAIIENNTIDYSYKYHNRETINELFARRSNCDDILIVKNSRVTDTSYTNVVFKDFKDRLFTPTSTLLAGTKRQSLLEAGIVNEKEIYINDIGSYIGVYLINAMMDIEVSVFVTIENIRQ